MKISITGLGWFGLPLAKKLSSNHDVIGTSRHPENIDIVPVERLDPPGGPSQNILKADVLVLNIPPFENQLEWFKSWDWNVKKIIFISSTSKKDILLQEEDWVKDNFDQWTILRFGGLYGDKRHPGKSLSGKQNLPGKNWPVNLLHLEDAVNITEIMINENHHGKLFEVVCGEHPTREEYYTKYCRDHQLPVPEFNPDDQSSKPVVDNSEIAKIYNRFIRL